MGVHIGEALTKFQNIVNDKIIPKFNEFNIELLKTFRKELSHISENIREEWNEQLKMTKECLNSLWESLHKYKDSINSLSQSLTNIADELAEGVNKTDKCTYSLMQNIMNFPNVCETVSSSINNICQNFQELHDSVSILGDELSILNQIKLIIKETEKESI